MSATLPLRHRSSVSKIPCGEQRCRASTAVASELVPLTRSGRAERSFFISSIVDIEKAPAYHARDDKRGKTKVVIRIYDLGALNLERV